MLERLRPLFPYLKRYRRGYLFGIIATLLNNGVWILFPLIIRRAIDDLNSGVSRDKLSYYAGLLIAVVAVKGIFQFLTRWIVIGMSREIEFDLRNDLFRHLETLSHPWYQRTRTGDVMARATNDLNAVRMLLGPAIMYTANTIVFTAGALVFMFSISPKLTLYAFAPLPVASIIVQHFGRRIHERFERIQEMFSEISARVQENLSGARIIRAFAQERFEVERFEVANREYIARSLRLVGLMGMLWPTLELLLGMAIVLVLWLGGREVLLGHMTVGDFVAFNTYMVQLTWPVIALGWVINIFQRGTASMGRINEIFQEKAAIIDESGDAAAAGTENGHDGHPALALRGEIEFRDLTFSYENVPVENGSNGQQGNTSVEVLHGINLRNPGRLKSGDCGSDRLGQDDAGEPDSPHLRCRARDGAD